jgi:hypothetical protein
MEQESLMGCGFMTRLGCTKPLWCIGNWCMASPPCSDITIRTARQETVHQEVHGTAAPSPPGLSPSTRPTSSGIDRNGISHKRALARWTRPPTPNVPDQLTVSRRPSGELGPAISFCSIPRPPRLPRLRVLLPNWSILLIARGPESQNGRQVINNRVSSPSRHGKIRSRPSLLPDGNLTLLPEPPATGPKLRPKGRGVAREGTTAWSWANKGYGNRCVGFVFIAVVRVLHVRLSYRR